MAENDERDDQRGLPHRGQRRAESIPDYAVVGPQEIERIVERLFVRLCSKFLTAEEIDQRINEGTAARWWSVGIGVSAIPAKPGKPEEEAREIFTHLRQMVESEKVRKSNPYRTLVTIAAILGGFGGFMSVIFVILGHVAWK